MQIYCFFQYLVRTGEENFESGVVDNDCIRQSRVMMLGADAPENGFPGGAVTAAGPFKAYLLGSVHEYHAVENPLEKGQTGGDGRLHDDCLRILGVAPAQEVRKDFRMHDGLQTAERFRVGEYRGCQGLAVQPSPSVEHAAAK